MSKVKLVSKLKRKGYPTSSSKYKEAHAEADKAEKKRYPKGYQKLKKSEKHMGKTELMGKNTKSGKIEVEKKYKRNAKEIAFHERKEHAALKRLSRRK